MPQAVITVAGIAPPAIGKKQGKITDTTGTVWNAWGDKLQNYRIGVSYEITYEEGEFNGHQFKTIKTGNPTNAAPPVQMNAGFVQPQPAQQPSMNPNKDEMIFVCGALNNALANPNVTPFQMTAIEIATFVKLLRQVWRATLGNAQQPNDEMGGDRIPF